MNDEPVQVSGSVPLSASQGFNNKNGNGLNNDFSSYRARENRANSDPSQISGLTKLSASQVASPTIRGTRPPQLPNRNVANRVNGVQKETKNHLAAHWISYQGLNKRKQKHKWRIITREMILTM